jgi:hypothetical protein
MATIPHPHPTSAEPAFTPAEDALWEAFADHLDTLSPEQRAAVVADLRANAEAHGE